MNKSIKTILIVSFMFTTAMVFAFPPDVPNEPDPPAPLANYVLPFLIFGIALAYREVSKKVKEV